MSKRLEATNENAAKLAEMQVMQMESLNGEMSKRLEATNESVAKLHEIHERTNEKMDAILAALQESSR